MGWIIKNFEPVYVDDPEPAESMDCMMCPCTEEECKARKVCYWDEVWGNERQVQHDSI